MPHIDPFAPANSPSHPRFAGARATGGVTLADLERQQQDHRERTELLATHLTPAEKAAHDRGATPDLDVLRLRRDALVDYLERREQDADAEAPTVVDADGTTNHLIVSEDGRAAHWEPAPDGADDYDRMLNADLEALLKDRELPHTGNKADMVARLREHDAGQAPAADALSVALADLDAAKGKR